jgi:hypothetical protein
MQRCRQNDAVSSNTGVVLMVLVVVVLAAILLALLLGLFGTSNGFVPPVVQIVVIHDYDEDGTRLNYDSRVLLRNVGSEPIPNGPLTAEFYRNGARVNCRIVTLHGEDFIPSHHQGIERIQGQGCRGEHWVPGASILLDFTDGTFRPGDVVRVEIVETETNRVISRHTYCVRDPVR